MLSNYVYQNNGTMYQPAADTPQLGQQVLVYNVSSSATSDALPYMLVKRVYNNVFITADSWGDATVSVQVSIDGVKNWTTLNTYAGTPLSGIVANTFAAVIINQVYIRAVVTTTSGVNISVVLC